MLNKKCANDLIHLIEELAHYSISPIELKQLCHLLREDENFDYHKELLQALASSSLYSITNTPTVCNEFFDIQNRDDGITVPEINKWIVSGSYGFVFHAYIRLDEVNEWEPDPYIDSTRYRRIILSLLTSQGTGYEIFVDSNGKLVVGILTKKEYFATTVSGPSLIDKKWHLITIGIIPPKRPFQYTQITGYIDGHQKLEANIKLGAFTEPFLYCTIGTVYQKIRRTSASSQNSTTSTTSNNVKGREFETSISVDGHQQKGMFPSLMERSFLPQIVSQVPSYFSLPIRNTTSHDPNVKSYPMGMHDGIFGPQACLRGQLGPLVLADPSSTTIKTLIESGYEFASIISQDIEPFDLATKYIFCYTPSACYKHLCIDLVPGNKFNGHVVAKRCKTLKIQDAINSIGGIFTLLPILNTITKVKENSLDEFFASLISVNEPMSIEAISSPNDELIDWEILASTTYAERKMMQNPVACFLCMIRYFITNHTLNQEQLMSYDCVGIISSMLTKCDPELFDVNVLMASQLLIESVQNQQMPNKSLLDNIYNNFIFDFKVWSRTPFQVTIGHIQYLSTIVKNDRKYFK